MSGENKEHLKQEFAALGGQLSNIVNRIRKSAVKNTTGGTSSGTSVKSTFGYLRWSSDNNTDSSDGPQETDDLNLNTSLANNSTDFDQYEGRSDDGGDGSSTPSEKSSIRDGEAGAFKTSQSNTSLEMPSEPATNTDTITEWQAGWNVTNAIQGMFIVSFPYTVHQGGYWALFAMCFVAIICCHTGKILVDCLYEEGKDGRLIRVHTSYGDIAEHVFGKRVGKPIVNVAQVIELLMTCILYVLLCGELLKGSIPSESINLSVWICLSTVPLLFCAFLKTMRRVSWLSLWCTVAHMLINIIIIIYCFTLVKEWQPRAVKINPDIWTVPISLGIIVFSYTSQIFLPTLEGKMVKREKFSCMMHWTHIAAAIFKVVFSWIGYVTWGEDTEEVITNNLPQALKVVVNIILVAKALFSYPLPYFAAVEIIEKTFFQDQSKTVFPSCYRDNMSIKWWGIGLRILLVMFTLTLAVVIPHFSLLMGLIGSFTGTMLSFVWPCVFHLYIKRDTLPWYKKALDLFIILLGIVLGAMGIYYSGRALILAFQSRDIIPSWVPKLSLNSKGVNETMKSALMG